jgi:hypothetical protein
VWISYPKEQYENLLDYFQFSELSYSDLIHEEYETTPIMGLDFPPPRYSFSFISKEMDLAVIKVPSKEHNTKYYKESVKGVDSKTKEEIDLFMRCDFVKYKNGKGKWEFKHFNEWRNENISDYFLKELIELKRRAWANENYSEFQDRFVFEEHREGSSSDSISEFLDDFTRGIKPYLKEDTSGAFLRLTREHELVIRGIISGLIEYPEIQNFSKEEITTGLQEIANYGIQNWRKDRNRPRAEEKSKKIMKEANTMEFDQLRKTLHEYTFEINDMYLPDQRYDTGKQIDLMPFLNYGSTQIPTKEWWSEQEEPIIFTKNRAYLGALIVTILCSPLLLITALASFAVLMTALTDDPAMIVGLIFTLPLTGGCWFFLVGGVIAGQLVRHRLIIDGKNNIITSTEDLWNIAFYDVDKGKIKLSDVKCVRTWGLIREEGPSFNKVVICKDPYKSRKSDLDVSWLFTTGKIDSRELASELQVPWKPRSPPGDKGRFNPGLEKYKNPDW